MFMTVVGCTMHWSTSVFRKIQIASTLENKLYYIVMPRSDCEIQKRVVGTFFPEIYDIKSIFGRNTRSPRYILIFYIQFFFQKLNISLVDGLNHFLLLLRFLDFIDSIA